MVIFLLVALAYADPEADPEADAEGSADYQLETDAWVGNDGGYYGYYPYYYARNAYVAAVGSWRHVLPHWFRGT